MFLRVDKNTQVYIKNIVAIINTKKAKHKTEIIDIDNNRFKTNKRIKTLIKKAEESKQHGAKV